MVVEPANKLRNIQSSCCQWRNLIGRVEQSSSHGARLKASLFGWPNSIFHQHGEYPSRKRFEQRYGASRKKGLSSSQGIKGEKWADETSIEIREGEEAIEGDFRKEEVGGSAWENIRRGGWLQVVGQIRFPADGIEAGCSEWVRQKQDPQAAAVVPTRVRSERRVEENHPWEQGGCYRRGDW